MKRTLASVALTALTLGGMAVAAAAPASAHDKAVQATCSTLTVNLTNYQDATLTISRDGEADVVEDFHGALEKTVELAGSPDQTWHVHVDAHDDSRWDLDERGRGESCDDGRQTGVYVYKMKTPDDGANWGNSGPQTFVTSREGDTFWTRGELPVDDLPSWVCGPGWAVQQDIVALDERWNGWPETIEPPTTKLGPWLLKPHGSVHQQLSDLVDVPACGTDEPVALPAPTPVEVCGTADTVSLPASEYATYDETWDDTHSHATVTATPTTGVVLDEGAQTTWEFDFDVADCAPDLQVATPVVPEVSDLCGTDNDEIVLPVAGGNVSYESTADGIIATADQGYALTGLPEGYVSTGATTAVYDVPDDAFTEETCALTASDLVAVCDDEVPALMYALALPKGLTSDDDAVTATFVTPEGDGKTVTDLPLEGNLPVADGNQVRFEVAGGYSTVVDMPASSSDCVSTSGADSVIPSASASAPAVSSTDTSAASDVPLLAQTGAKVGAAAALAVLLILGGGVLFWLRRRVQQD